MKVYGPYKRSDGRKHVVIVQDNGAKQTKSYPRYLMEQHLGRKLSIDETVDHINNDRTDDRIENLQLLSQADNARKEMSREHRKAKMIDVVCPNCLTEFSIPLRRYTRNQVKLGKDGPYCSKSCAGKVHH